MHGKKLKSQNIHFIAKDGGSGGAKGTGGKDQMEDEIQTPTTPLPDDPKSKPEEPKDKPDTPSQPKPDAKTPKVKKGKVKKGKTHKQPVLQPAPKR